MRTGAIFARGSCRALKWMALVGVVFALGAGSALAQLTITATTEDMAQGYSGKIVTIMVVDGDGDAVPVWGTPLPEQFAISAANNAVMAGGIGGLSPTAAGATSTFTLTFVNDVVAGTDTITLTDPGEPATGETNRRLLAADDATGTDDGTDPDVVTLSAVGITEALTAPDLPLRLDDHVLEQGEEFTLELPEAVENSGVGVITYSLTGTLPTGLSFTPADREIDGTVSATAETRDYPVSYTAVDSNPTPTTVSRSFTITVTAPLALPGKPQNLMAMPGDGHVTLTWEAPPATGDDSGGDVESYEYDQNASGVWMDAGTGLTKTVMGLDNGTTYVFQVRAKNRKGTGPPTAGVSATPRPDDVPLALPGMPQNLTAKPGNGEVTLSWDAPADGGEVASYQYDMAADGNWMDAGMATARSKTVMNLTNGDTYVFRLRARNATGPGAPTGAVSAIPTSTSGIDAVVTVKEVKSATTVDEAGGLEVTVTANVPAGEKVDNKIAPIDMKMVMVEFVPSAGNAGAEADDTTLLGTAGAGYYEWKKIPRTEKASTPTFKFRVAIGQDLDAEDEKFKVKGVRLFCIESYLAHK